LQGPGSGCCSGRATGAAARPPATTSRHLNHNHHNHNHPQLPGGSPLTSNLHAALQIFLAVEKLAEDCGFEDIIPKLWIDKVDAGGAAC
jgi:hypothetical protein